MDTTIPGDRLAPIAAFVRVVERGSFTAAARDLSRSTSSVSRQVSALEERLGARLLHRSTRAVSPTAASGCSPIWTRPKRRSLTSRRRRVARFG